MRILHTSDWHLGQNFYGKSRAAEHQAFLNWLLEQVRELKVDALIVAGDIFDTGSPPSYAREMLNQFVVSIQKCNCQLVLLGGNHDSVAMLNESKALFSCLNSELIANVQTDLSAEVITLNNRNAEPALHCCAVPFIRPRDVLTSQSSKTETDSKPDLLTAIKQHYQTVYQLALDKNKQLNQNLPIMGTGHLTVVNAALTESVRDIYIGSLEAFPASEFPPFDYLALGHIHQPQQIADNANWRYSGSPIAMSFDETSREKSVVLVDFDEKTTTSKLISVPIFQAMFCLSGSLAQIENQLAELFIDSVDKSSAQQQSVWLDLEIDSSDFHSDVQKQAEQICEDYPVEILLVRRKRNKQLNSGFSAAEKLSLDEIDPTQVFKQKLSDQGFEVEQTEKLETLFAQTLEQIRQAEN
ncbi:exonuclease subunit SbcD [Catenovulum sp. 2E275]|uniref:exonuclease subunit SbcD n=1 Tax=Catenovulum sp. 2E275 TaxID=2980497 RepID=UPI0021D2E466|nr:exonuclease subunit SbcD [Catenovulum sp. 2E275]MCU4675228.1 exonuclease subunit SbcD [Catenovulum sp. 2E275]